MTSVIVLHGIIAGCKLAPIGPDHALRNTEHMFRMRRAASSCPLSLHPHWYRLRARHFAEIFVITRESTLPPRLLSGAVEVGAWQTGKFQRRCRCCMRLRSRSRTVTWQR